MALMLGINMIDLIPNATLTPLTWLLAGAILGYAEAFSTQKQPEAAVPVAAVPGLRTIL